MKIPLLKDHHNHPFLYTSLSEGCINLEKIKNKKDALTILAKNKSKNLSTVTGWYNNFYTFEKGELDKYSPLVLFNISFHEIFINEPANVFFYDKYPSLINNRLVAN